MINNWFLWRDYILSLWGRVLEPLVPELAEAPSQFQKKSDGLLAVPQDALKLMGNRSPHLSNENVLPVIFSNWRCIWSVGGAFSLHFHGRVVEHLCISTSGVQRSQVICQWITPKFMGPRIIFQCCFWKVDLSRIDSGLFVTHQRGFMEGCWSLSEAWARQIRRHCGGPQCLISS